VFSYRPGDPLEDYKVYFDRADPPEPRFEVNHAGYRMLQSACFKRSNGKLTCTTCHDPHTAKARNACADCHTSPHANQTAADCAGCHMPKRRTSDAIHVSMTDHWIQRKPVFEDPTREDHTPYNGPVVPFYTKADSLTLAIANVRELTPNVVELYRKHLKRDPKDVATMAALGNALYRLDRRDEALPVLGQALRLDPGHAGALNTLAVALATRGEYKRAITLLNRARQAHPEHSLTWANLGVTYQAMGNLDKAREAYLEAIRLQPDFSEARARLASLQ
jgi:tetratricopeptide (TPR) repeat protein